MKWVFTFLILSSTLFYTVLPHAAPHKTIRFATEATYPPFEYTDELGEIKGFDIDIAKALCQVLQADCTFSNQSFNSLLPSLALGKFDAIIATLGVTEERKKQVNFTDAYYEPSASLVAPLSQRAALTNMDNKIIGTQQGSTFEKYLRDKYGHRLQIKSYASAQDALLDLIAGRSDAVLTDTPIADNWLRQGNNSKQFVIVGKPIVDHAYFGNGYGIAVSKKNPALLEELNRALKTIKDNGTYATIKYQTLEKTPQEGFVWQVLFATWMTLKIAICSLGVGLLIGIVGAALESIPNRWLRYFGAGIIFLVRGLPELLILFFIYFGLSSVLSYLFKQYIDISSFMAGVVALSLIFGAYASQVFRGAFLSVERGQLEAGKAVGLTGLQIFMRILLPQAWRHALPGLSNLWLVLLKDTAIVSLIGLSDVMNAAKLAASTTQQPFTFYLLAAGIYLVITSLSQVFLDYLTARSNRYMHP